MSVSVQIYRFQVIYFSRGCAIEEEQEVVITGTGTNDRRVTRYKMSGESESLPSLNTPRNLNACGYFINSEGATVSISHFMIYYYTIADLYFPFISSNTIF